MAGRAPMTDTAFRMAGGLARQVELPGVFECIALTLVMAYLQAFTPPVGRPDDARQGERPAGKQLSHPQLAEPVIGRERRYLFSTGSGFFAPPGIGVRSTLTVIATRT